MDTAGNSFSTVLVQDPRLLCTPSIKYAVYKGAQNITASSVNANSSSASQINFNVIVPSENIIIDRRVLIAATVNLTLTGIADNGALFINPGETDALQCFPLQKLFSTMQATINNTTVAINLSDVIDAMLLMNERADLYKFNATTPTLPDGAYLTYVQGAGATNNPLMSYSSNDMNNSYQSRGAFPITITQIISQAPGAAAVTADLATTPLSQALLSGADDTTFSVNLSFSVAEPLLLSPFLFGDPSYNNQGFYGIQNMTILCNVGNCNRVWSSATANITSIGFQATAFTNARLILNYLTPQPSQLLTSRNAVPHYTLPRFFSNAGGPGTFTPMAMSVFNPTTTGNYLVPGLTVSSSTIVSNSLQLSGVPDKLIIFARNPLSQSNWQTTTNFLVINKISINFNNSSGLLSSVSQYSLWQMSVENGSTQSWGEFCGWQWDTSAAGNMYPTPTQGSLLVLDFAKDIQLPDWLSPGSIGNYSLQLTIEVINQSTLYPVANTINAQPANTYFASTGLIGVAAGGLADAPTVTPELVIIPMMTGTFVNDRGTSNYYENLLTKEDVLNTSETLPYTRHDVSRLVGGNMLDKLKTSVGHLLHKHGHHHKGAGLGDAVSGAGLGAAVSGGAMHHGHHKLSKHIKK